MTFAAGEINEDTFIVDSGCTQHMSSKEEWFTRLRPHKGTVKCASKMDTLEVTGIGDIEGMTSDDKKITLKDVLLVPRINGQLVSVNCIEKAGFSVIFNSDQVFIKSENECMKFAEKKDNGQYICDFSPIVATAMNATAQEKGRLWHRRLGHPSVKIQIMMDLPVPNEFCEICCTSKQTATPMGKGPRTKEKNPWLTVHTDICGPIFPTTASGVKYFMTLIDEHSRFTEVKLLRNKSEAAKELIFFLKLHPTVRRIRCDNAREYFTGELLTFTKKSGIEMAPLLRMFLN